MRFTKFALICMALAVAGCSSIHNLFGTSDPALRSQAENAGAEGGVGADGAAALKLDTNQYLPNDPNRGGVNGKFKLGTSSETVEKLAKQQGCESKLGAALITDSGPIEKYMVSCQDGSLFMAKCELRQCVQIGSQ